MSSNDTKNLVIPHECLYENLNDLGNVRYGDIKYRNLVLEELNTNIEDNRSDFVSVESQFKTSNFPNPFNNSTLISFYVNSQESYEMKFFDINGKTIDSIFLGKLPQGEMIIDWAPMDIPSGTYFYSVFSKKISLSNKLLYIK